MSKERVFTVTEINSYIKHIIENDILLSHIHVKGEISNFKLHGSGHLYFTLKDADSRIKCVMFRGNMGKLKFRPEDGMAVVVRGYFSIYERDGQYQFYAEDMAPEGTGSLYKAYEQLKKKLSDAGWFDAGRKKKIPYLPQTVGVVTSPTGAAVRDIISIIQRRCPCVDILLYPVLVQGENAEQDIARAIRFFNEKQNADVLIVGRGGGSIEELWAFNEEAVAQAIYESRIPVVSAVGHETDFTIADFVADLRAATPSAAAELVVPDRHTLESRISQYRQILNASMNQLLQDRRARVEKISKDNVFRHLERKILNLNQTLDTLDKYLHFHINGILKEKKSGLEKNMEKLEILNPESALSRGFAYIKDSTGSRLITSIAQLDRGEKAVLVLKDGHALVSIEEIHRSQP